MKMIALPGSYATEVDVLICETRCHLDGAVVTQKLL